MKVKELKEYISKLTKKANTKIKNIAKKKKKSKAVEKELEVLKKKGIIGKSGKAIKGFGGKTKAELQAQARELEYFNQWRGTETKEIRDSTNYKKYQTFVQNNPDFADYEYQDWRDLVETFGSTSSFIDSFSYENVKELHKEITRSNSNVNLAGEMRKVLKENKGAGLSREDAIDLLRSKLFNG